MTVSLARTARAPSTAAVTSSSRVARRTRVTWAPAVEAADSGAVEKLRASAARSGSTKARTLGVLDGAGGVGGRDDAPGAGVAAQAQRADVDGDDVVEAQREEAALVVGRGRRDHEVEIGGADGQARAVGAIDGIAGDARLRLAVERERGAAVDGRARGIFGDGAGARERLHQRVDLGVGGARNRRAA